MKTEEDEAFDDLAKRQGDWGGGFQAKRRMAEDKLQEPWNEDEWRRNNWRCQHGWLRGEQCEICNASLAPKPAQEPIYKITVIDNAHPKGIPFEDWVQPTQDVDYWIREATAARQAEMALRRELAAQPAQEPVAHILQFIKELRPAIGPMAVMGKSKTTQEWFDIVINEIERLQTAKEKNNG